jgi:hypothetical protein
MPQKQRPVATPKEGKPVKTTLELPEELWNAAKKRAVDERTNLRALIIRALERELADRPKRNG